MAYLAILMLLKEKILSEMISVIDRKVAEIQAAIDSLQEGIRGETKSSVGDKFETARAMMQEEKSRNSRQLFHNLELRKDLVQIKTDKKSTIAELGSLVFTDKGNYFLSVALGKIKIETEVFFALSLNSPVGRAMEKKKEGEDFFFQEKKFHILKIE